MSKLSRLFRWSKKVNIVSGGEVLDTVYIRLVGDSDFQESRIAALKASKNLRIRLRDKEDEEHLSTFSDINHLTKDELIMGVCYSEIPDYRDEAIISVPEKTIPELPDSPSLEEQEQYQNKLETMRNERAQALAKFIEERSDKRREELKDKELEDLKEMYMHSIINMKCGEEFTRTFREYQVYKGTYTDEKFKNLAFDNFEDFVECAPQLKSQLLQAYIDLEISGEDLKN